MEFIRPKDRVTVSSLWSLKTEAFDLDNTPTGSFRKNPNTLITPDVPRGVLGGMVAAQSSGDWESTNGLHNMVPLGLFNKNSEGNPYENAPAIASGVVGICMNGGAYLVYMFETHAALTPFTALTLSTAYFPGTLLYCSPYSLLTPELPTTVDGGPADGIDYAIALVSKTPGITDQELGIKLLL